MFKDLKKLVKLMTHQGIKLNIELLSGDILVPEWMQGHSYFCIQGRLIIDAAISKRVNSMSVKFSGSLDSFKNSNFDIQKSSTFHNQLELLSQPVKISEGTSVFGFEFALPRSLPSSTNSILFRLRYSLTATIEFEDNTRLIKSKFVKVCNNYLLPFKEVLQSYYEDYGTIRGLVNWRIEFESRIFNIEEFAKLKLKLEPQNGTSIGFINAKLLQESLIFSNVDDLTNRGEPKSVTQLISQRSFNLASKYSENIFKVELPIKNSTIKKSLLVPSMNTELFKNTHMILIEVNYTPSEKISKKKFRLNIQVAICSNFKALNSLDLPSYDDTGTSSNFFSIREQPPNYSI
jgi:hypothetical protein